MTWVKRNSILIAIISLALLLRLIFISSVPVATTGDQLHYITDAHSFLLTGKDTTGAITPLHVLLYLYPPSTQPQAELPYFLQMISITFLGATPISVVIPNVLLSIGSVLVLYFLGKELFDKNIGLAAAFITAINPWSIAIGRTGYEMGPATFFYCLALLTILKGRGKYLLLTIPLMLLSFDSYIGTKLIFAPFFLISLAYSYFFVHKKKNKKYFIILFAVTLLIPLIFFIMITIHPGGSRLSEILTPVNPSIEDSVNKIRKLSFTSPLNVLFENKLTIYARILLSNALNVFSPSYLFLTGDYFFSIWRHGLFYIVDGLFLIIGMLGLFITKRKEFIFLMILLGISILPQIAHESHDGNFTPHISLLFPIFYLIIGYGVMYIYKKKLYSKYRILLIGITCGLYTLSLLNFVNIYFNQSPFQSGVYSAPLRIMAHYVYLAEKENNKILIHTGDPTTAFANYVFYSNLYNKNTARDLNKQLNSKGVFTYKNVTFASCGAPVASTSGQTVIYENLCEKTIDSKGISIAQLSDSGSVYTIYNDHLCNGITMNNYISGLKVADLDIEKHPSKEFCKKFLVTH